MYMKLESPTRLQVHCKMSQSDDTPQQGSEVYRARDLICNMMAEEGTRAGSLPGAGECGEVYGVVDKVACGLSQ